MEEQKSPSPAQNTLAPMLQAASAFVKQTYGVLFIALLPLCGMGFFAEYLDGTKSEYALPMSVLTTFIELYWVSVLFHFLYWNSVREISTPFARSLAHAARRFWPILLVNIIFEIRTLAWAVFLIFPGLRYAARHFPSTWIVVVHNVSAIEAFTRASALTNNKLLACFTIIASLIFLSFSPNIVIYLMQILPSTDFWENQSISLMAAQLAVWLIMTTLIFPLVVATPIAVLAHLEDFTTYPHHSKRA